MSNDTNSNQHNRAPHETLISYDEIFKRILEHLKDESIIAFINGLGNKNLPLDLPVERLQGESNEEHRRISDVCLRIGGATYNIELESNSQNKEMALRMFEYGFRTAKLHGDATGHDITLTFPSPAVIYLQTNSNTPKELGVNVDFPHINQTVRYTVPALHMPDFSPMDLADKKLLPLLPFYPMSYKGKDISRDRLEKDLTDFHQAVNKAVANDELTKTDANSMYETLRRLYKDITTDEQNQNLKEALMQMEHKTMWVDVYALEDNAVARGEINMLRSAMQFGVEPAILDNMAKQSGISPELLEEIRQEMRMPKTPSDKKSSILSPMKENAAKIADAPKRETPAKNPSQDEH